ncbi:MAG: hypothetical protein R3Y36_08570 [Spirochaetales bacterium]
MNEKSKISSVIISVIVGVYAIGYTIFIWHLYNSAQQAGDSNPFIFVFAVIPLLLLGGIIATVKMRIKEINKGELDEAKKY